MMVPVLPADDRSELTQRIRELERQLEDAQDTLLAIKAGDVDAVVVSDRRGEPRVYTLEAVDYPNRVLIEQIREGVVTIDGDGNILFCNQSLTDLLAVPYKELIGQNFQSFVVAGDAPKLTSMLHDGQIQGVRSELTVRARDGRPVAVYLSLSLLRRYHGMPLLCGVVTDLTEQKALVRDLAAANARLLEEMEGRAQVEEALRHAQKMDAIGRLAAGVAHDFNNILQSIVGGLELVLDLTKEGTPASEFAGVALNAARRGASLTQHLLSYARKQMLMPQIVQLEPFLADLQRLLERTLGAHITIDVQLRPALSVRVDPGQLETAMLNLAINAADAMPQGGTLTIACAAAADVPASVIVSVCDSGVGMDAATLARAVEPFFTTKGLDGSGLGLSMVQGFVEQSGGRFQIDSALGAGTRVEMHLPSGTAAAQEDRPGGPLLPHGCRILLVDDAADVLITTGAFLEKVGFAVVCTKTGDEALTVLAAGERFDALISDYAMPGLSGTDLITKGRTLQPGLPAIIITGFAGGEHTIVLPEQTLILRKPFARDALLAALQRVMEPNPASP